MELEYWAYANWITKVALYFSIACIVGGSFFYFLFYSHVDLQKKLLNYICLGVGFGLFASVLGFGLLIGSLADSGILGMFNTDYLKMILNTATGIAHILRIVSFALLIGLIAIILIQDTIQLSMWNKTGFSVLVISIVYSFSQLGHVTNLSIFPQILLSIHVLMMSLWLGSLYPLYIATRKISGFELKQRVHLFGQIASFMMVMLLLCGVTVALLLIKDLDVLLHTEYGVGFIVKIGFVMAMLLLAALNKWYLTPKLQAPTFAKKLTYVLVVEMFIGLSVISTTGYITTVVGLE
ncbi:copper resistance D family protein [Acinetobacter boissieri]|uniref:Copper resistance protein D n=1 Tax=Acinetobacter boissieri TaxID=1219383 RepID=A0A1G6GHN9_9GAMM|nr:CopD family protein [Acinetobacter boissieri]SDB81409.1 putative copper resistance protein D [Acinetobacter boissieri]